MRTRIQKWGNSLALRIPKTFAVEAGLLEQTTVNLTIRKGKVIIEPQNQEILQLDDLLQEVTDENLHREWETGPPVGKEIW